MKRLQLAVRTFIEILRTGHLPYQHPTPLPELIICYDIDQARRLHKSMPDKCRIKIVTQYCGPAQLLGASFARVTVMPGVDFDRDVYGEGSLRNIVKSRQRVWGEYAHTIEL